MENIEGIEVKDESCNIQDLLESYPQFETIIKNVQQGLARSADVYQQKSRKYASYPRSQSIIYPTLGLCGESGEVSDKVKKVIRDNKGEFTQPIRVEIAKELGDVLWYIANLSHDLGFKLSEIMDMNISKLESRYQRNKIHGSGDNR